LPKKPTNNQINLNGISAVNPVRVNGGIKPRSSPRNQVSPSRLSSVAFSNGANVPLAPAKIENKPWGFANGYKNTLVDKPIKQAEKFWHALGPGFTTGAADDLERATELARNMVCVWGMSEELGPRTFGKKEELMFLAREVTRRPDYSEETARLIDAEVKKIIDEGLSKARLIMRENFAALERLAEALLRQETLNGEEVEAIWRAHMSSSTP